MKLAGFGRHTKKTNAILRKVLSNHKTKRSGPEVGTGKGQPCARHSKEGGRLLFGRTESKAMDPIASGFQETLVQ